MLAARLKVVPSVSMAKANGALPSIKTHAYAGRLRASRNVPMPPSGRRSARKISVARLATLAPISWPFKCCVPVRLLPITGHWEMASIITAVPFPTYPHGFPAEVISD